MTTPICLHNATVLNGYTTMKDCGVLIHGNKIIDVFNEGRFTHKKLPANTYCIDLKGAYIAPGLIDTHIHGIGGFGTEDCKTSSILKMSEILIEFGVTSFIPTIYASKEDATIKAIEAIVSAMGHEKGAKILGLHLEGPFNLALMEKLWKASKGHIINMTVAPELKNMRELALYCIGKGIILQAGHTDATYEQMVEGIQVRIMHVTHLFNAMSRMHHRDPGAVGAVFIHPELSCEIIADGIHINPEIIKFLLTCKPLDKVVLVTDSLKTTKQKTKPLVANNQEVYLNKCFYRKSDNVIAGSAMTMIESVKNIVKFGLSLEKAIQMATINPARIMRQEHLGLVAPGYDADLIVLNKNLNVLQTIIQGKIFNLKDKEHARHY